MGEALHGWRDGDDLSSHTSLQVELCMVLGSFLSSLLELSLLINSVDRRMLNEHQWGTPLFTARISNRRNAAQSGYTHLAWESNS